jgi:prepilin-type processing-associated H-X9-DG protein
MPVLDVRFYPGIAFVGYASFRSILPSGYRFGSYATETDWSRHRRRGDGGSSRTDVYGRANFGFADGHVESFTPDDLANRKTRKSKFVALWSPLDYHVESLPRPSGL